MPVIVPLLLGTNDLCSLPATAPQMLLIGEGSDSSIERPCLTVAVDGVICSMIAPYGVKSRMSKEISVLRDLREGGLKHHFKTNANQ